jgi:tRNA dimethylallyltransferase
MGGRPGDTSGEVIAIFGPTASGKSAIAEAVATRLDGELVSADSMQVYRGLPILTNQSPARLVAIWELDSEGSVGEYASLAHAAIDEILRDGKTPIVVGGTGLWLRAAVADLALPPAPAPETRARWEAVYDERGPERTHALLSDRDPQSAAAVHPNDRRRVVRALELGDVGASLAPERDRLWTVETRHPTTIFGLDVPRETLDRRLQARAEAAFDAGVADEARAALAGPLSQTARQALNLRDVVDLPRDEAIRALVARHRRLAAYQRKWMRRIPALVSVAADRPAAEVADEIVEVARARQRVSARGGR